MRENNKKPIASVQGSLKGFDITLKNSLLDQTDFLDISVKTTIQTLYDVGLIDKFDNKDEVLKEYITFTKSRREVEIEKI